MCVLPPLQVPVLLFKREKEIARNMMDLEWVADECVTWKSYFSVSGWRDVWDMLVLQTAQYPRYFYDREIKAETLAKAQASGITVRPSLNLPQMPYPSTLKRRLFQSSSFMYNVWLLGE